MTVANVGAIGNSTNMIAIIAGVPVARARWEVWRHGRLLGQGSGSVSR